MVGATAKGRVSIEAPIGETLEIFALCDGRRVQDLTTIVLDRPRHERLIDEIRGACAPRRRDPGPHGSRGEADRCKMADFGMDRPDRVLTTRDLAPSPLYVIATGVTDGGLLRGVRYFGSGARTHSIVMDLVGNMVRFIDTVHLLSPTIIREIRL